MPADRPCAHEESDFSCPCCLLYETDTTIRQIWGGPPLPTGRKVPGSALRRVIHFDHRQLATGGVGPRLNAGLTRWDDGWLIAYRTGWSGAQIHLALTDEEFHVQDSWTLALWHEKATYGREDPRLFWHRGRLHVAFIGVESPGGEIVTHQLYARLSEDARQVEEVFYPHYERRTWWEKNWSFFSHNDVLLAVYSIRPHVILRVEGNSAREAYRSDNSFSWSGGLLRGGAPPFRVGREYWHWFHGCHGQWETRRYNVGVAVFEAKPPFSVIRQSLLPVLDCDSVTRPWDQYCPVLFPCGAVLDGKRWLVSCGIHDRWVEVHEWDADAIARSLL